MRPAPWRNRLAAVLVEACVDSVAGAVAAERAGAHRVELCAALAEGGTTPSAGMVAAVRERITIPLVVMVRPRGGDFVYDAGELEAMRRDIGVARDAGAEGVAIGVLARDGSVDAATLVTMVEAAGGGTITFHRAFDMCRDLPGALELLAGAGVTRVLTSGAATRAAEGIAAIAGLVRRAAGRVVVMAGGGIRATDVSPLAEAGVREVHVGGTVMVPGPMTFRRETIVFGRPLPPDEFTRAVGDVERWRSVVAAAASFASKGNSGPSGA